MSTDNSVRQLSHLRQASTARVLNLPAIRDSYGDTEAYQNEPFFACGALNRAILLKHRVRRDESYLLTIPKTVALKLIFPFDPKDLKTGGKSILFGQRGADDFLYDLMREQPAAIERDLALLRILNDLPSLDPFLLREAVRHHAFRIAECYFQISEADRTRMLNFVSDAVRDLVIKAVGSLEGGGGALSLDKVSKALLSTNIDSKLEPLRMTLRLDGEEFREGMFSWRGFLYYKWCSQKIWTEVEQVLSECVAVRLVGGLTKNDLSFMQCSRNVIESAVKNARSDVLATLKIYDSAYQELVDQGKPQRFREFLLKAPTLFRELGEKFGGISHITSYWRYRFPAGKQLVSTFEEMVSIFNDFETCFGESVGPRNIAGSNIMVAGSR